MKFYFVQIGSLNSVCYHKSSWTNLWFSSPFSNATFMIFSPKLPHILSPNHHLRLKYLVAIFLLQLLLLLFWLQLTRLSVLLHRMTAKSMLHLMEPLRCVWSSIETVTYLYRNTSHLRLISSQSQILVWLNSKKLSSLLKNSVPHSMFLHPSTLSRPRLSSCHLEVLIAHFAWSTCILSLDPLST